MTKGQNSDQSYQSVAGIARSLYGRVFNFIVEKCNNTLVDDTMKKAVFIGVLDIAGFEIFEFNGFEQLCINFCNEVDILIIFFNSRVLYICLETATIFQPPHVCAGAGGISEGGD